MTMQRVRCLWQNWAGQPGYTNLYTSISLVSLAPIVTFWDSIKAMLPAGLTVTVPGSGDLVAEATGQIQAVWTATGGGTVTGTGAAGYSGTSGAVVEWLTGGIVNGRRVLGKTFIVPMAGTTNYESNGSLSPAAVTLLQTSANTMQSALGNTFVVWSRPFEPDPDKNPPVGSPGHKEPRAGSQWPVVGTRVPDLAVVMRSRRT